VANTGHPLKLVKLDSQMKELTQEYLKECLLYDPDKDEFVWKVRPVGHFNNERYCKSWNTQFSNKKAGWLRRTKIDRYIKIDEKVYSASKLKNLYIDGIYQESILIKSNNFERKQDITQEYLKECLDYDPNTDQFTWKERPLSHFENKLGCYTFNSMLQNKIAGTINKNGYKIISIDKKKYLESKLKNIYMYGVYPKGMKRPDAKGYSFNKINNTFMAKITFNGNTKYLGQFKTQSEAESAYLRALEQIEIHGEL
jgi:hypothetical protein